MATPRNILLLLNKFPFPAKDGYSVAVLNMIQAFSQAGHRVSVFSMNTSRHYGDLASMPDKIKALAEWRAIDIDTDIRPAALVANWLFSNQSYHIQRFTSKAFEAHLRNLLLQQTFDIIQLEGLFVCPYIPLIRDYAPHAKIVFRAHNLEHEIWARNAVRESDFLKKYYFTLTAERLHNYEEELFQGDGLDAIVPITARDGQAIAKLGAKAPIFPCNAGYDLSFMEPLNLNSEYPSVFYIGALDWLPNQEAMRWFLQHVWGRVHALYPNVPFYLAGRNMPETFKRLHNTQNIQVLGEVEDAYSYMREKGIMVVPLQSGGGMRIKLIEGMALGKAIVATKVAAEGIPAKHAEHLMLCGDTDAEAFVNSIGSLIEKRELAEMLGRNAQQLAQVHFDSRVLTEKLSAFYDTLLEGN